jgi:hypothetical protein
MKLKQHSSRPEQDPNEAFGEQHSLTRTRGSKMKLWQAAFSRLKQGSNEVLGKQRSHALNNRIQMKPGEQHSHAPGTRGSK